MLRLWLLLMTEYAATFPGGMDYVSKGTEGKTPQKAEGQQQAGELAVVRGGQSRGLNGTSRLGVHHLPTSANHLRYGMASINALQCYFVRFLNPGFQG